MLPAGTGSCQAWVMLAPEESIIIIFWLRCLGIFFRNLVNSWLYMGIENSLLFQLSAIRKSLYVPASFPASDMCMRLSRFWFYLIFFK